MGTERPISDLFGDREVNSLKAITLENNKKIRPSERAENRLCREVGGGTGTGIQHSLGRKLLSYWSI